MQSARLCAAASCLVSAALFAMLLLAPPGSAQTVETSQQTNERIRSLAAASHVPPPRDYVIGSGDLLSVQVFDVPELTRDLRVSQTGTIGIPLVPVRLHVSGLTELQAERKIAEVLEANGLVSHPEVSVVVKDKKSKPITVVGAVGHTMVYQADRQVTLIEVLAEAGGIAPDASDKVIVTRPEADTPDPSDPPAIGAEDSSLTQGQNSDSAARAQSSATSALTPAGSGDTSAGPSPAVPPPLTNTITVNLNQILETGDLKNNIVLLAGDVVTVPHAGIVYALGAIGRPGGYTVANDRGQLTTLKLLSLAGGVNRSAKATHAVIVRRDSNGQQHEVEIDLRKIMKFETEDVQLRPSDILYVPNSAGKQALIRAGEITLGVATGVVVYRLIP
jgi:polysaccharide biosynthesis/export protein